MLVTKRVITDLSRTAPYLVRWTVRLLFGWTAKLHLILRADDDRCAHDHPWRFWRIILWGGYVELCGEDNRRAVRKPWRPWAPWRVYYCPPGFRHRIINLTKGRSWTLVLCGPPTSDWGFYTRGGWMQWKEFVSAAWAKRVLWCDDGSELDKVTGSHSFCPKCGYPASDGLCDGCDPRTGEPIRRYTR